MYRMDATYSTLAFADAIHDFKGFAIRHKDAIRHGLPGHVLNIDMLVRTSEIEDTILDIFAARSNDIDLLSVSTPEKLHKQLRDVHATFGLVSDANGSSHLIKLLEKGKKAYYIVQNRENMSDSAFTPLHSDVTKGIIVNDMNGAVVKYGKWSNDHCLSSKFCSVYEYSIEYINSERIAYYADDHPKN
jgi:hypothetical protein